VSIALRKVKVGSKHSRASTSSSRYNEREESPMHEEEEEEQEEQPTPPKPMDANFLNLRDDREMQAVGV